MAQQDDPWAWANSVSSPLSAQLKFTPAAESPTAQAARDPYLGMAESAVINKAPEMWKAGKAAYQGSQMAPLASAAPTGMTVLPAAAESFALSAPAVAPGLTAALGTGLEAGAPLAAEALGTGLAATAAPAAAIGAEAAAGAGLASGLGAGGTAALGALGPAAMIPLGIYAANKMTKGK